MKRLISIAMATYNGEPYLEAQLDSFTKQTVQPDELVVSDDNSSDATLKILEEFKKESRFKVKILTNEENLGYTKNFERALSQTTGDFIFLSDQDDIWFENKIETMMILVKKSPGLKVFANDTEIVDGELKSFGVTKLDQLKTIDSSFEKMVMGTCTVISAQFLKYILPIPDGYKGHDNWIHDTSGLFDLRKIVPVVLQLYRIHGNNTSDYVGNTPHAIKKSKLFASKVASYEKSRDKLVVELNRTNLLLSWLDHLEEPSFVNGFIEMREVSKRDLLRKSRTIKERLMLYDHHRIFRILPAIKILLRDDYKYFNGVKSMVLDIFLK